MAGEIMFDNSALSRLFEETDLDRRALLAGLRTLGTVRVTALNVLETAKTPNLDLRMRKLRFYGLLSGTIAPINTPVELLHKMAQRHHEGSDSINVGDQVTYTLLANPEAASEEWREELEKWAEDEEARFKSIHPLRDLQSGRPVPGRRPWRAKLGTLRRAR